jgi:N-acetylglutamate synthase-like GNAT family acetyltransferase
VSDQVRVRDAREEDLPRILALLYQLSQSSSNPEATVRALGDEHRAILDDFTQNPHFHLLVLEVDGEVQGTLHLYLLPNMGRGGPPWAVVEHVVVDEAVRSHRYGELLMAEAIRRAKASGSRRMSLGSNLRRTDSHRFYERLGFKASQKGFVRALDDP